jgi:Peptidase C13 family
MSAHSERSSFGRQRRLVQHPGLADGAVILANVEFRESTMHFTRRLRAPFFAALFSLAFLTYAPPRADAQAPSSANALVVPAPPFIYTDGIGIHQAQQNRNAPETAHDRQTGDDLKWDRGKKTWVDAKTGQALGFDGQLASDGTVIPAPPFIVTPEIGLHQASQGKTPDASERAFDTYTRQSLMWDRERQTWIEAVRDRDSRTRKQTGPALGFDGAMAIADAPEDSSSPSSAFAPETGAAGPCPTGQDLFVLIQFYDYLDARTLLAAPALSEATADRQNDLARASQLDQAAAANSGDADVANAQHQQAQGLRDKLPSAQSNYAAASKAAKSAWDNYEDSLARLQSCSPENPAQAGNATVTPAMLSGALVGFAFVGADNAVSLGRSPTAPAGAHAAAEATVSVGSVSSKTDDTGAFTLTNLPAGLGTLHVATTTGVAADFPVTVLGGATARLGAPAVTRADALAIVKKALAALTTEPKTTVIIGPQEPLPAGTTVAPAFGNGYGQPSAALDFISNSEQWLIFVDPKVVLFYQHPVEFFFVDAATGALTKLDETSWPFINGLSYYGDRDTDLASADLMVGPTPPFAPKGAANESEPRTPAAAVGGADDDSAFAQAREFPSAGLGAHVMLTSFRSAPERAPQATATAPAAVGGTTYALIVQGGSDSAQNADVTSITSLFGHGGIPPANVLFNKPTETTGINGPGSSPRINEFTSQFKQQCSAAQPNDTFFIYITAHGSPGGGAELDSNGVYSGSGAPLDFEKLTGSYFDFTGCKAGRVVVIIDTCYSAKLASQIGANLTKAGITNATVISATDADHSSLGVPLYGSLFTTKFVDAFNAQVAASPTATVDLRKVFYTAADDTNSSFAIYLPYVDPQNPQLFVLKPPAVAQGNSAAGGVSLAQPAGSSKPAAANPAPVPAAQPQPPAKPSLSADLCERAKVLRDIAAKDRQWAAAATDQRSKDYFTSDATMMDGMAKQREDLANYYDPNSCPPHGQAIPQVSQVPYIFIHLPDSTTPDYSWVDPWTAPLPGLRSWNTQEHRYYGYNADGTPRPDEQPAGSSNGNFQGVLSGNSSASPAGETSSTSAYQCTAKIPVVSVPVAGGAAQIEQEFDCSGVPPVKPYINIRLDIPATVGQLHFDGQNGTGMFTLPGTLNDGGRTIHFDLPAFHSNTGSGNPDLFTVDYSLIEKLPGNPSFRERLSTSPGIGIDAPNWSAPISDYKIGTFGKLNFQYGARFSNNAPALVSDGTWSSTVPLYSPPGGSQSIGNWYQDYRVRNSLDYGFRGFSIPSQGYGAALTGSDHESSPPPNSTMSFPNDWNFNNKTGALSLGGSFRFGDSGFGRGNTFRNADPYFQLPWDEPYFGTPKPQVTSPSYDFTIPRAKSRPVLPYTIIRPNAFYLNPLQYFVLFDPWNGVPYYCSYDFPDTLRAFPEVAQALAADAAAHGPRTSSAANRGGGAHFELVSLRRGSPASDSPRRPSRPAAPAPAPAPDAPPSVPAFTLSIVSNGKSTGLAFNYHLAGPTANVKSVHIADGTVLEAIKPGVMQPADAPPEGSGFSGALDAFCVNFHKPPPPPGTYYRVADDDVQEKFASLRYLARAAAQMSQAKQFHADSNLDAYKDAIFQYAIWSLIEGWGQADFTQNFDTRTKENAEALHIAWTPAMENAVLAAAPGRWRDISEMETEAEALEKAASDRTSARRARRQQ